MALAGTKEGLYMVASLAVPETKAGQRPIALMPNPYYLVYSGGAHMAGAETMPLDATEETGFLPDLDAIPEAVLARTALFYLCSPANPQGANADLAYLKKLIGLARRHDFVLVDRRMLFRDLRRRAARGRARSLRRAGRRSFQACWCSIRCRSARTPPACASASSPATRTF